MKKLRVAIVGLGFGYRAAPAYRRIPETELALLCDIDEKKCKEYSEEFGVPYTLDFEDCLKDDIDLVDVSTPNHLHMPQSVAALEAGKHVYLQKPMAPTPEDCMKIVEKGRETGLAVGMYMSSLNVPYYHDVRKMIADGALGKVTCVRARTAHRGLRKWAEMRPDDYWRNDKDKVGGGGMALIGIHMIHLAQWLMGQDIVSVVAESDTLANADIMTGDDITACVGRFKDGAVAVLEASYATEGDVVGVYGTKGFVESNKSFGGLYIKTDDPWHGRVLHLPGGPNGVRLGGNLGGLEPEELLEYQQHAAFVRAVLAGEEPPAPGEHGMRDVALLKAIYEAAETGKRVVL